MEKELFIRRLKIAMSNKNMTQYTLSKLTRINKGSLSSYMSGKYLPKPDKINLIAQALEINPQWLMCTTDIMDIVDETSNDTNYIGIHSYPLIEGGVSAGIPDVIDSQNEFEYIDIPDSLLGKYSSRKNIIVMKVNGESMNKTIPHGATILVAQDYNLDTISTGDIVVFSHDYSYSVKRFINDKKNRRFIFSPESFEECFEDLVIDYDKSHKLELIGKVIFYSVLL